MALCRELRFELIYLRLCSVYGQGQYSDNFWPCLRRAALAGVDFPMTMGDQVRDFMPVEDVALALLRAVEQPPAAGEPRIRNVGTGKPQSTREFAAHWWRNWGARGQLLPGAVPYRPNEVMRYVPEI